jgi:membrane fusion protein, heavy metal efflux system
LKQGPFAQKLDVRAPISGKVLEISVTPGEFRNDTTVPVMTIADLSTIWVSSDVPESYIRLIRPGEQVEISLLAYPGETFSAQVRRIADMVDPQTRSVKVQAELDNAAGRFRPEMYGSIRHTASTERTPAVPAAAVIQGDDQTAVFVEQGAGRFQQTSVKVGKLSGNLLPVREGLKPGDRIVIDGTMLLNQ